MSASAAPSAPLLPADGIVLVHGLGRFGGGAAVVRHLRRLGFVVQGYARDYLHIDGEWRDHILTALTNPNPEDPELP